MAAIIDPFVLYSNICAHAETGDLLGMRMAFIALSDGKYVFFQAAEGTLETPQILKLPSDSPRDGKFDLPIVVSGKSRVLRGTVGQGGISGSFADHGLDPFGKTEFHLTKVSSPDAAVPQCR